MSGMEQTCFGRTEARKLSRRKMVLTFAGLVAGAGAALRYRRSGPSDPAALRDIPFRPDYAVPAGKARLRVFSLGDSGTGGEGQYAIASAIAERMRRDPADFLMLLGDNIYPGGATSATDDAWTSRVVEPYGANGVPIYACLGNHDHKQNPRAQVDRSTLDPRWRMPSEHYAFIRELLDGTTIQFFVLDTTPIAREDDGVIDQVLWLQDELARSTARWKIVVGHHPMFSNTNSGESRKCKELLPLLARYGVDVYLSGHSHALEVLRSRDGVTQVVAGGGGGLDNAQEVSWEENTEFAATRGGFVVLTITSASIAVECVRESARTQYVREIVKS